MPGAAAATGAAGGWVRPATGDDHLDHKRYTQALRPSVDRLVEVVGNIPPDAPIEACPGWDVARLVVHLGTIQRWVAAMVRERATDQIPFRPFAADPPPDPAKAVDWLRAGADDLVRVLAGADGDTPMWSGGADQHVRFWSRRMLHELLVHTADAEVAAGERPDVAPWWARDGVDEFLENLPFASSARGRTAVPDPAAGPVRIVLAAAENRTLWEVDWTPPDITWNQRRVAATAGEVWSFDCADWAPETAGAAARVSGLSRDLYLWLWGRVIVPSPLVTGGDPAVLSAWRRATTI